MNIFLRPNIIKCEWQKVSSDQHGWIRNILLMLGVGIREKGDKGSEKGLKATAYQSAFGPGCHSAVRKAKYQPKRAIQPWARSWITASLSPLNCKMKIPVLQDCYEK